MKYLLFIFLMGCTASAQNQSEDLKEDIEFQKLDEKVDIMQVALRRCDSSLASATAKLSTLESLGKIQSIK